MTRSFWLSFGVLALIAGAADSVQAAIGVPKAELWSFWDQSDERGTLVADHRAWQLLLDTYLITNHPSGIHRFDYAGVTGQDRERLNAYIDGLAALDPRQFSRAEQRAYWINLYNALTVKLVVDHYPVKSIRKIHGGLLGLGPWNRDVVAIAGQSLTLNDIEHRILRPIWRDPRIHYAVNCASLGCPNLAATAFTAENSEQLLDAGARSYVNHPRGVSFDGQRLRLSSIYDWYQRDFGQDQAGLLTHLARHAEPELAERLRSYSGRIKFAYDWALNAAG